MAQLQPFIENIPELLLISAGRQSDIRQVDRDNSLVEPSVVFVLSGDIVFRVGNVPDSSIGETVRGQEGTAAHAGVDITL